MDLAAVEKAGDRGEAVMDTRHRIIEAVVVGGMAIPCIALWLVGSVIGALVGAVAQGCVGGYRKARVALS